MPASDSTFNLGSLTLLLVLLALNGLAVAVEFAYVRVRRTRLDELIGARHGRRNGGPAHPPSTSIAISPPTS